MPSIVRFSKTITLVFPSREPVLGKIVIVLGMLTLSIACSRPSAERIQELISNSDPLQRADRLCSDIPTPTGLYFVRKDISGNSEYALVTFEYLGELKAADVAAFYRAHFNRDGWDLVGDAVETETIRVSMLFRKGEYFVSIERVNFRNASYAIGCGARY